MTGESFGDNDPHRLLANFDPASEPDIRGIEFVYRTTNDAALKERCAYELAKDAAQTIKNTLVRIEQNYLAENAKVNSEILAYMAKYFGDLMQRLQSFAPRHELIPIANQYLQRLIDKLRLLKKSETGTLSNEGLLSVDDATYQAWLQQNPDVTK